MLLLLSIELLLLLQLGGGRVGNELLLAEVAEPPHPACRLMLDRDDCAVEFFNFKTRDPP